MNEIDAANDAAPSIAPAPASWRLLVHAAGGLQAIGAVLALPIVWWEVETIVAIGPILSVFGLVIAAFALSWSSRWILALGLWHPLGTAAFATCIAVFHWNPPQAENPARFYFTGSAALLIAIVLSLSLDGQLAAPPPRPATARRAGFRFSMRAILITMTLVAFLTAVGASLTWRRETPFFVLYAAFMFGVPVAAIMTLVLRENSLRPTRPPDDPTRGAPDEVLRLESGPVAQRLEQGTHNVDS